MKKQIVIPAMFALLFASLSLTGCDDGTTHTHEWEWIVTTAPTCEDAGVETERCKLDSAHTNGTRPIAALGHTWGAWTVTTPATCTASGTGTRVCTVCGETDPDTTIPIDPDAHNYGTDWVSNDDQHWRECECGDKQDLDDHEVETWTQTKAPTFTEDGEEEGTCTVCTATATRPITKLTIMIDVVHINAGKFNMGSPADEPGRYGNETQREVTLTQGFYMGKYQVTQEQWLAVMGKTIIEQQALATIPSTTDYGRGDKYPMYFVSWYEALVFCNKLSVMEGLTPAYSIDGKTDPDDWGTVPENSDATWNAVSIVTGSNGYRLPTEAQWEYACRAGATTAFNWGTDYIDVSKANYNASIVDANNTKEGTYIEKTTEVGSYAPNAWGLYDMHGNVWEWCWDWYQANFTLVCRGGSWHLGGRDARSASRDGGGESVRHYIGFRLVRP